MTGLAALLVLGLATPSVSPPSGALEIDLHIDPCLGAPEEEVRRLTALELTVRVVSGQAGTRQAARVEMSCAENGIVLRVTDKTGKVLERTLTFESLEADVRSRALALAVTELVLTSWMEAPERAKPAPAAPAAPSPLDADERAARESNDVRAGGVDHVIGFGLVTAPFDGIDLGWGGGVRLAWISPYSWLGADLDVSVARAEAHTALGDVSASSWSAALRGVLRGVLPPLFVDAGAGLRLGIARLSGTPNDSSVASGGVVAGPWAGPLTHAGLGVKIHSVALVLGVEGGYRLRGVTGEVDGTDAVPLDGAWLSVSLGAGWSP
jgi:hypothetical protein